MSRPRDGKRLLATTAFGHVTQDQPLLPFMWPMRASFFFFLSLDGSDKNSVETDRFPAQIAAGDDEKRAKHARALGSARSAYRSVPGLVSAFQRRSDLRVGKTFYAHQTRHGARL